MTSSETNCYLIERNELDKSYLQSIIDETCEQLTSSHDSREWPSHTDILLKRDMDTNLPD